MAHTLSIAYSLQRLLLLSQLSPCTGLFFSYSKDIILEVFSTIFYHLYQGLVS